MKQSGKFKQLLELVLLIGNYMNAGSKKEQSLGFEMNFLTKVRCYMRLCGAVRCKAVLCGTVWCDAALCGTVWCDAVCLQ